MCLDYLFYHNVLQKGQQRAKSFHSMTSEVVYYIDLRMRQEPYATWDQKLIINSNLSWSNSVREHD